MDNLVARVMDASVLDKESIESADIVIADLPCSGLGVFGKKPDIKYKMKPEQQKELVALQRKILEVVTQYVKKVASYFTVLVQLIGKKMKRI